MSSSPLFERLVRLKFGYNICIAVTIYEQQPRTGSRSPGARQPTQHAAGCLHRRRLIMPNLCRMIGHKDDIARER
eukprot:2147676-Pleurochrysis_carterae.AAC.2